MEGFANFIIIAEPIRVVLENNGKIKAERFFRRIGKSVPGGYLEGIYYGVHYSTCLSLDNQEGIVFNRDALFYSHEPKFERAVQFYLHRNVRRMERFQLYPFCSRATTRRCFVGIPWKEIPDPKVPFDLFEQHCDYRCGSNERCKMGCGVGEPVLEKYDLI